MICQHCLMSFFTKIALTHHLQTCAGSTVQNDEDEEEEGEENVEKVSL